MAETRDPPQALEDIRVLELADEKGLYCGKLLADMGAQVIKVERPGGDTTRDIGPFYQDQPHRERSLFFWHYNTSKQSVTLSLETPEGRGLFRRLAAQADIIIETLHPGHLEALGLGYDSLAAENPGLIMTSITGFGPSGPYSHYKAPDIVGVAMGGMMSVCGEPETPPLQPYGGQAYHAVSSQAAIGALIALYARDLTGRGQRVQASMQAAVAFATEFTNLWWIYQKLNLKRHGSRHGAGGPGPVGNICHTQDGYICIMGGNPPLDWMEREGLAGDLKGHPYWTDMSLRRNPQVSLHVYGLTDAWTRTHSKMELFHACQAQQINWAPVYSLEEVHADPHLRARDFFVEIEHPELGASFEYPGAPYKFGESPWRVRRRAPLVGEDNAEVYGALGLSKEELALLAQAGVI